MSYATMNHAAWVQRQIQPGKAMTRKARKDITKGWHAAPDVLTPFQCRVFDILDMVGGGIYNAPINWDSLSWKGFGHGIAVPWLRRGLSTFDYSELTRLVFLCHEARIRCEIRPHGPTGLLLMFHQRVPAERMGDHHPNLDEAVATFREYLAADHQVIYREEVTA